MDQKAEYVNSQFSKLTYRERQAVMTEALQQYENREGDDSDILDFIHNGIDMLKRDNYVVALSDNKNYHLVFDATGYVNTHIKKG